MISPPIQPKSGNTTEDIGISAQNAAIKVDGYVLIPTTHMKITPTHLVGPLLENIMIALIIIPDHHHETVIIVEKTAA
jgi:hypothetical protein